MGSPFPGMDPYLEKHWGDVHLSLIIYARDRLQPLLPTDLRARVQERILVEPDDGPRRTLYPDLRVVEKKTGRSGRRTSTAAVAEPVLIELDEEPERQGFLEILDIEADRRVVTVLEILSPTNKQPGKGQDLYRRKQREVLESGINFVEIDLLRAGDWAVALPPDKLEDRWRTCYRVVVRRGTHPERAEYYPISLRKRLPTIGIPLRGGEEDVPLDLQELLDQVYEGGAYDDLDYGQDPPPPLTTADRKWLHRLLQEKGLRGRGKS